MAKLTDYVSAEMVREFEEMFSVAADCAVRLVEADGVVAAPAGGEASSGASGGAVVGDGYKLPVVIDGETVAYICSDVRNERVEKVLGMMAQKLPGLCRRERRFRSQAEEMAMLSRLTAEFSGQKDLQSAMDVVARTVVSAMKVKACSIRLLNADGTELVIMSVANLSPAYLDKGPILLSESVIDREALTTGQPVYIGDERTDPRVLYPAEAAREGIVSAMLAPMIYKGHPEGVIRVYTDHEHRFDWFETSLLQVIASAAAAAIVNSRLYSEALSANDMKRQVHLAAEVQRQMIPDKPPEIPGFDFAAAYSPCFDLGGDFYDFIDLPPDNLGLAVGDVAGKNIKASLLMASVRASLRAHAASIYDMRRILGRVNRDLCADTRFSNFATLFYGVLDYRARRFTYSSAGHLPPILIRDGNAIDLTTGGGVLGINSTGRWRQEVLDLCAGDLLLAFTDGLVDGMNFSDESFGRGRIVKAAQAAQGQGLSVEGIIQHILWELRRFTGLQSRLDDLTLIGFRVL